MPVFECKQGYTFKIQAKTEKDAMKILESFYVEENKILYRADSRIKLDRSKELVLTRNL
jgi:hypothetical protein